jgi:hypothetical protein
MDSAITPIVAIMLLIAVILILALPRKKVIAPFLIAFFTIPIGEVLVIGGFHFTALRVLILAALGRRLTYRKNPGPGKYPGGFNSIDWVAVGWAISAVVAQCLLFKNMPAVINGFGELIDTLGGYLVVRSLVMDSEGVRRTIKTMAAVSAILGLCMINERVSKVNVFGYLGGIGRYVTIRDGHIRAGATLGCLYAGAFAGVLIPVFVWLWKEKKSKLAAVAGIAGATAMVVTSYSSTSWMAFGGSFIGMAFWPLRKKMRMVRWGIVAALISLQMVMKAPVWALIARIDLTGSSSGEQRYMLIDMTMKHIPSWFLIGTSDYTNWGWDSWDLCNQFVAVALTGGMLTLVFYISIFSRGFGTLGNARKLISGKQREEWLLWCLGSALFATIVAHFGINYMAQLIMGFFPLVACISVASWEATKLATRPAPKIELVPSPPAAPGQGLLRPTGTTGLAARVDPGNPENPRPGSLIQA